MGNSVEFVTKNHNVDPSAGFGVWIDLNAIMQAVKDESDLNGPYHSLLTQVYSIQAAVEATTVTLKANDLAFAEAEWEQARAAAREALDAYNVANNQELRYRNQLQRAIDERTNAIAHLNALKESKPDPKQFPSPDEIREWEQKVEAAQGVVDEKIADYNSASRAINLYYGDVNNLGAVLNAASNKEMELRLKVDRLKGIANTAPDSKTGLKEQLA